MSAEQWMEQWAESRDDNEFAPNPLSQISVSIGLSSTLRSMTAIIIFYFILRIIKCYEIIP